MVLRTVPQFSALFVLAGAALLAMPEPQTPGAPSDFKVLRIGTTGSLAEGNDPAKEKSALKTLKGFIKDETDLDNEIIDEDGWQKLCEKMSKGDLQVGVFQGYEYAWASEKYPELKPIALALNVYRYPTAHVVTQKDNKAKTFADLKGGTLDIPSTNEHLLKLYINRQCKELSTTSDKFFSKINVGKSNIEDILDDVVDGMVQAAAVDRAALEAFKTRKPARFNKLKEVAKSQPFPPVVVACYGKYLDAATLRSFREGLLNAHRKEKGQTTLTLFHITGFETVPNDFAKVLEQTRKSYPPDEQSTKK
jgi:ABC-type phosphate/phosphonate transport system substrate-binding protein